MPIYSLWKILEALNLPEISGQAGHVRAVIHDPCTSRDEKEVQKSVIKIAEHCNVIVEELELSGEYTQCCGFGALMFNANPDMAKGVAAHRITQSPLDYITYCSMCRDMLAAEGKSTTCLLDLLFPPPPMEAFFPLLLLMTLEKMIVNFYVFLRMALVRTDL